MIVLFSILFACNRVEPLDSEQICDGLDDDQDGLVDEGLFISTLDFVLDEAGVINLDRGVALQLSWAPGIEERTTTQVSDVGDITEEFYRYDGEGNIVEAEYGSESDRTVYERRYEGSELVYDLSERFEDGELTSKVETVIELTDSGQRALLQSEDFINGEILSFIYTYDEQDRQMSRRQEGPDQVCLEWFTRYDDTLMQKYSYDSVPCDEPLPSEPAVTRSWDADGNLISVQTSEGAQTWGWEGGKAITYTIVGIVRSYEYEGDRLVGAQLNGSSVWELDYDELERFTGYVALRGVGLAGLSAEYHGGAGSSVSKVLGQSDSEPSYELLYELDELGNLVGSAYEDLVSGATTDTSYSYTCQSAD